MTSCLIKNTTAKPIVASGFNYYMPYKV